MPWDDRAGVDQVGCQVPEPIRLSPLSRLSVSPGSNVPPPGRSRRSRRCPCPAGNQAASNNVNSAIVGKWNIHGGGGTCGILDKVACVHKAFLTPPFIAFGNGSCILGVKGAAVLKYGPICKGDIAAHPLGCDWIVDRFA